MYYAQQKQYPYYFIKEATNKDITTVENIDDAILFDTRKQAKTYFNNAGYNFNKIGINPTIEIINNDPFSCYVYRDDHYICGDNFDSKAALIKHLKLTKTLQPYEKVSFKYSKLNNAYMAYIERDYTKPFVFNSWLLIIIMAITYKSSYTIYR